MKRLFTLSLLVFGACSWVLAQTAILVRDSQPVSAFYGAAALANAVSAAEPTGDVILLSSGTFNNPGEIKKSVSIYGQGHEGADRTIIRDKLSLRPSEAGSIDNIHLEGLYMENHFNILNDGDRSPISNLTVVKCHITGIFFYMDSNDVTLRNCVIQGDFKTYPGSYTATNMLVENCWKDGGSFNIFTAESTITVRNSIFNCRAISGFDNSNAFIKANFENSVLSGCVLAAGSTATNCVLLNVNALASDLTISGCWEATSASDVFQNAESCVYAEGLVPAVKDEYVGTDDTPVGITGGNYPWDVVPAKPIVNYETTLTKDAEGFYEVGSAEDWKEFERVVETLNPLAKAKMTADIDLGEDQTMVGGDDGTGLGEHPFCGIFDGQGHTLTVNYNKTGLPYSQSLATGAAPFLYIMNATIRDLHVAGTIKTSTKFVGGVVGDSRGTQSLIERCRSSVSITSSVNGEGCMGGIISHMASNQTITIQDCVFDGSINAPTAWGNAGIQGYKNGTATYLNCLAAPSEFTVNASNCFPIVRNGGGTLTISNCHYSNTVGTAQGNQATAEELASGRTAFYLQAGREEMFWGQEIGVDPQPVLTNDESKRVYRSADGYTNDPELAIADQSLVPLLYTRDGEGNLTITGFDPGFTIPEDYALVIPDDIDGSPVTAIANSAFFQKSEFTSLYIGKNVKTIGNEVFRQAKGMKSVTFADDCVVETLGGSAFRGCDALSSFIMPNSVKSIGEMCFQANPNLSTVTLSDQLTTLASSAFNGCPALTDITIPSTVTSMGTYVFQNCTSLQTVTFAEGTTLTAIPDGTFDGCTALNSFTIPASVSSIYAYAFRNCTALSAIAFPDNVTRLGGEAFRNCSSLTEVTLPATITAMDANVFWNSGVTKADVYCPVMGQGTFYQCANLESVTIHEGVTTIGLGAFHGCTKLPAVDIPGSVTAFLENAFRDCSSLTSVVIPASVASIGNYAFSGCTQLQSVSFADEISLPTIPVCCFYECRALESISIPASVSKIDNEAFRRCSAMTSVSFPENSALTTIGDGAFRGCEALPSIVVPESVTSIGALGFQACTKLEEVTLPSTLRIIRSQLFQESGLKHITLPVTVEAIENNAFYSAVQLEEVIFPQGLTSIGNSAFRYCEKLNNVVLPSTLTSIQDWAFANCTAMENLTLEEGITSINRDVFQFSGMKHVVLPSTLGTIGVNLFHQCNQLEVLDLSKCVNVWELYSMTNVDRTGGWNIFFGVPATTLVKMPPYAQVEAADNVAVDKEGFDLEQDEEGYYLINIAEDWDKFVGYTRANPTASARLNADLDLIGHEGKLGVGNGEASYYTWQGTLDGQGHYLTIRYKTNKEFVGGLFAYVENATIKNLRVHGDIDVIYRVVGGYIGFVKDAVTIEDCESDVNFTVTPSTTNMHIAGFIGQGKTANIQITDCLFKGSITGLSSFRYTAGFMGWMESAGRLSCNSCLNIATISNVDMNYVYSLGATQSSGQISASACYFKTGNRSANTENLTTEATVEQLASGKIAYRLQGGREVQHWGQLIGTDPNPRLTNEDGTRVYRGDTYTNEYVEEHDLQQDAEGYYLVGNVSEWRRFAELVGEEGMEDMNVRMTDDIDLGTDQTMIGSGQAANDYGGTGSIKYRGIFDGQGHTLKINYVATNHITAPFRYIQGVTIKNLHVEGSITTSFGSAAGIVGVCYGQQIHSYIENCVSSVHIFSSYKNTGGFYSGASHGGICASLNYYGQLHITDCVFDGSIRGETSDVVWGGMMGIPDGTVTLTNCLQVGEFICSGVIGGGNGSGTFSCVFNNGYASRVNVANCHYLNQIGNAQGTQASETTLSDGTVLSALQTGREEEIWKQNPYTNQPMLTLFCEDYNPDGIGEVKSEKLKVKNDEAICNLAGQKIINGKLSRGIYIMGGRKVLVR